ncbi:TetR/AcrR family transcriptional regulator [Streptomyces solicathayae]|uniref:TetR/AcrR family transcriptional regulator n=1 Tax=Streptomyces solicathayae TaxID=3081768 RepID=A0ABZ0M2S1_9ACTN|nr:TetR/AcrR family transcriptional regulator [Streptomyces sp. HUAS YS2]WOX25968.1 TetR/AcrR family transcriptional regulator [Streptomyces sp. HUAS YS2]
MTPSPRQRLAPEDRRRQLLSIGAQLFAEQPYDEVRMDHVAARAGVSRALLYRYFPNKRDLFTAVYRQATDRLIDTVRLDPAAGLEQQLRDGLDAHFDYFTANRHAVLAANRVLAGDATIQAMMADELEVMCERLLDGGTLGDAPREAVGAVVMSWLVFVRVLCVEWLQQPVFTREELREMCVGSLLGALRPLTGESGRALGDP